MPKNLQNAFVIQNEEGTYWGKSGPVINIAFATIHATERAALTRLNNASKKVAQAGKLKASVIEVYAVISYEPMIVHPPTAVAEGTTSYA
jgi:hypothetical protein